MAKKCGEKKCPICKKIHFEIETSIASPLKK